MRVIVSLILFIVVAASAWRVASIISPDAVSMAVGMLFGVLAGIPTTLLVMAGNRRRDYEDTPRQAEKYGFAPPVIVLHSSNDYSTHNHLHVGDYDNEEEELFDYQPSLTTFQKRISTRG